MSFILEALRKSEAERRRGQSPDLLAQPLPVPQHARKPLPAGGWWLVALALSLLVVAVLVWRWPRPISAAGELSPPDAVSADPHVPSVAISAPGATPTSSIESPGAPAAVPEESPAVAQRSASAGSLPVPAAQQDVPETQPATEMAATPSQRAGAPALEAPHASAETSHVTAAVATTPATVSVEPARDLAEARSGPAGAAPAAMTTFSSPDLPLRLSDLSAEERQQLPALKVSMHMWAPENERRFVIIDGSRVAEGDRVGEATIESIQADAVLLAWRGRRIRLAIR